MIFLFRARLRKYMKIALVIILVLAVIFACVWLVKLLNVKDFDKSIQEEKKKFFPPPMDAAKNPKIRPANKGTAETKKIEL